MRVTLTTFLFMYIPRWKRSQHEVFCSVFSLNLTEYGDIRASVGKTMYSIKMREKEEPKSFVYGPEYRGTKLSKCVNGKTCVNCG